MIKNTGTHRFIPRRTMIFVLVISIVIGLKSFLLAQTVIENPATPLAKNAGRVLKLEEVWRITDESGEFFFKGIWALKVGPDGAVYIFDSDQLLKFTAEGRFVADLLKKGQGPGEVSQASRSYDLWFFVGPRDLYIFSVGERKVIHVKPDGSYLVEFKLQSGRPNRFWGAAQGWLVFTDEGSVRFGEAKVIDFKDVGVGLLLVSSDGTSTKKILTFTKNVLTGPKFGMDWDPFEAVYDETRNRLYVSHTCEFKIEEIDITAGKVGLTFGRKYDRVKYDEPVWQRDFRKKYDISMVKQFENDIHGLFFCKGNLWVRTSTKDEKKNVLFDAFDREGKYIDCFYVPVGDSVIAVQDDFLYMRGQAEDGSLRAVKYRIVDR
jgi:hypothetical protein